MKIFLMIFLFCLAQIVFSKSEDYYIEPNGPLVPIDCIQAADGIYYYGFYFPAMTSGFPKDDSFYIPLDEPKHAFAECSVNAVTGETQQQIECYVNSIYFPLFTIKSLVVPSVIKLEEDKKYIQIENWQGGVLQLQKTCYLPYTYEYIQSPNQRFEVTDLADGTNTKILTGYGTFQPYSSNNKLTVTEYTIRPSVLLDNEYKNIDCIVSPANGGEDSIECTVKATQSVSFFQTMAYENNLGEYVRFNVEQEVSLYGSFIKLSSILLLSLFLF